MGRATQAILLLLGTTCLAFDCVDQNDSLYAQSGFTCAQIDCTQAYPAAYCPVTCNLCQMPCADYDAAAADYFGNCANGAAYCTVANIGQLMQVFCGATCGLCGTAPTPTPTPTPTATTTCVDFNTELNYYMAKTCAQVDCTSVFESSFCPVTCAKCDLACQDDNNAVATALGSCTSAASQCTSAPNSFVMRLHCPVTCGFCTPASAASPTATPTPGSTECVDHESEAMFYLAKSCTQMNCTDTFQASLCPVTCSLCGNLGCMDNNAAVEVALGSCATGAPQCNTKPISYVMQLFCPITCGACDPSEQTPTATPTPTPTSTTTTTTNPNCVDDVVALQSATNSQLACDASLCSDNFLAAFCPVTCNLCNLNCADYDSAVSPSFTSCASAQSDCNVFPVIQLLHTFCPVTCGVCGSTGSFTTTPTPTPTPTTTTTTTPTIAPTPTPTLTPTTSTTCTNNVAALQAATSSQITCSTSLCSDNFLAAFCPQTCSLCNKACADDSSAVAAYFASCSAAKSYCTSTSSISYLVRTFCPVTCATCTPQDSSCVDLTAELQAATTPSLTCDKVSCSDPLLASYCRATCQLCDMPCGDYDEAVSAQFGSCSAAVAYCNAPVVGQQLRVFCGITCNSCECKDQGNALLQATGQICTSSVCGDNFLAAFCPVTCGLCDRACEDSDTAVAQYFDSCSAASNYCLDDPIGTVLQMYCPVTCGACEAPWSCTDDSAGLQALASMDCSAVDCSVHLLASYCPQTCNLCSLPCGDINGAVSDYFSSCQAGVGLCNDPTVGGMLQLFCPVTCGICVPTQTPTPSPSPWVCADNSAALLQLTQSTVCETIGTGCDTPVLASYCPETCNLCSLPCADNDATAGVSCADNASMCSGTYANMFNLYCPVTCGTCTSGIASLDCLPSAPTLRIKALRQTGFTSSQQSASGVCLIPA